eukprot:12295694-Alexandrium_andersonii.AAC.1
MQGDAHVLFHDKVAGAKNNTLQKGCRMRATSDYGNPQPNRLRDRSIDADVSGGGIDCERQASYRQWEVRLTSFEGCHIVVHEFVGLSEV